MDKDNIILEAEEQLTTIHFLEDCEKKYHEGVISEEEYEKYVKNYFNQE